MIHLLIFGQDLFTKIKIRIILINEIISNNNIIKFTFLNAFGIKSDFNKFSIKFEIKYVIKIN